MTLKEIVFAYLREHGYDGLWNNFRDCACKLDDLIPCDECIADCEPGYLMPGDEDYDFNIGPEKVADRYLAESEREE